jgi:hypothetical protein
MINFFIIGCCNKAYFSISGSLPNNTNIRLWIDGDSMNLLFNLTYPAQQNTTVTIVAATLRLYKLAQVLLLTLLLNTME